MKFDCAKSELIPALNLVSRGVASKTTMPILEGVLFEAFDHKLFLTSTNLEISVKTSIPAHIEQDGEVVLKSSFISQLIRKLSGEDIYFDVDDNAAVTIKSDFSTFHIKGMPSKEFPQFPEIIDDYQFTIDAAELKSMIHGTIFAVAIKENIPVLTGLKLEITGDSMTMIALDGYRLALRRGKLSTPINEDISIIVPGKSMTELDKLLANAEGDIQVNLSKSQIFFTMDETTFTSRLLEGEFINYQHIIPKENNTTVVIDRRELLNSTERAALLAREGKNNLIKMQFDIDSLTLTGNAEIGDVHEVLPIDKQGDDLKIAFNSKFIIDALRAVDDDKITIALTNAIGPAVITSEDDAYIYLILPVRVSDEW